MLVKAQLVVSFDNLLVSDFERQLVIGSVGSGRNVFLLRMS